MSFHWAFEVHTKPKEFKVLNFIELKGSVDKIKLEDLEYKLI